jgi:hypothetical protein
MFGRFVSGHYGVCVVRHRQQKQTEGRNRPRATGRKERKMTVFQELTKGMKFSAPSEDIKKNMVKVFEKNFGCPPWNDEYEEGCKEFTGCESCWFGYINSEAK